MNEPDRWLILDCEKCYRIFAVWAGGYTTGDSWQMNSGIDFVKEDGDYFLFYGYSGSIYKCHKKGYGSTAYGFSVLPKWAKVLEGWEDCPLMQTKTYNIWMTCSGGTAVAGKYKAKDARAAKRRAKKEHGDGWTYYLAN